MRLLNNSEQNSCIFLNSGKNRAILASDQDVRHLFVLPRKTTTYHNPLNQSIQHKPSCFKACCWRCGSGCCKCGSGTKKPEQVRLQAGSWWVDWLLETSIPKLPILEWNQDAGRFDVSQLDEGIRASWAIHHLRTRLKHLLNTLKYHYEWNHYCERYRILSSVLKYLFNSHWQLQWLFDLSQPFTRNNVRLQRCKLALVGKHSTLQQGLETCLVECAWLGWGWVGQR